MATSVMVMESHPQTPEEKIKIDVQKALMNLGPCSHTIDKNCRVVLDYIVNKYSEAAFSWIVEQTFSLCMNLVRYIFKHLTEALCSGKEELHIVLVGKGSISDQDHPADWLMPLDTITDTILYPPWNCAIDAKVAYGISTGRILPEHRAFRNGEPQEPLPNHWNSMAAQRTKRVPNIILSPMENAAEWRKAVADMNTLYGNHKRRVILYPPGGALAEFLPALPLYQVIILTAALLEIVPPHRATFHIAAGLEYTGAQPPNERMWQNLYAYTPSGTVMTMRDVEFPGLYGVLELMFN